MITVLAGLVALLIALVAVAFFLKVKHSLIIGGTTGLIAGFMLGLFAATLPGFTHYFGPAEIPDPIIQVCGIYTGLSSFYPPIFAVVGLIVGVSLGALRKNGS